MIGSRWSSCISPHHMQSLRDSGDVVNKGMKGIEYCERVTREVTDRMMFVPSDRRPEKGHDSMIIGLKETRSGKQKEENTAPGDTFDVDKKEAGNSPTSIPT